MLITSGLLRKSLAMTAYAVLHNSFLSPALYLVNSDSFHRIKVWSLQPVARIMIPEKIYIGWREWCALPELGLPYLKVKTDTGAATSVLHAMHPKPFKNNGIWSISFDTHPLQKNNEVVINCTALLIDQRLIVSSNGMKQHRYVIKTPITLGGYTWEIEITLTNRNDMGYRMLLGRQALHGHVLIDPERSFSLGKVTERFAKKSYKTK